MKKRNFGRLLAIMLAVVLVLALIPFGAITRDASNDAAPSGKPANEDALSEIRSQTDIVNDSRPAASEGFIVKLRDASYAEGLTCISESSGLYRAETQEQLDAIPDTALDYCEPDFKLSMLEDTAVNDTLYVNGAQWNLENMKVPAAWAKGQFGEGVTVAVIDSGLYGVKDGESHEDIDPAKVVKPYNARINYEGTETVSDDHGHGTFVAGMIFANTNNSAGIAGITPNVSLMPIKVSTKTSDAAVSDVVKAINYAVANGADVINMSLGSNDFSQTLKDACDAAVEKGVIVVAAAGNDGNSTPCYPAAYDSVVGVGSLTKDNLLAATSQYGESVYVTAPGAGVVSTDSSSNGYKRSSGTSFASPEAAALAAMARAIDPSMDQDGFKKLLRDTCTDLGEKGHDSLYGYGMLNFEKAVNTLLGTDTENHNYGDWVSDGASTHSRSCTDDGCAAKETQLHTWDAGTALSDGSTKYTCTACKAERVSKDNISGAWEYRLINDGSEIMLTKYIGDQTILVVPSSMDVDGKKLPVTAIGNETFMGTKIFWLELPDSISYIEDGHQSTSGIIGACAFCKELTVVKLSAKTKKVADYMFYGAGSSYRLELTVPEGVKEIGISAFSLCNSIIELKLPASVEKIDNSAFYQARRLKTLNIPGVKTVEADAFTETIFEETYEELWKAGEFEGIVYAGNVAYLYFGPYVGSGDKEYIPSVMPEGTSLALRDGTLGISEFCFTSHYVNHDSCKQNLKSITVPNSLAYIPDGLFDGYNIEMNGFEKSYAEGYAARYDNIKFNAISLPAKPTESYDWYDKAQGGVYELATAGDLWGLADLVETGEDTFAGKTVKLKNDIDLVGVTALGYTIKANEWFPLGIYSKFAGTLDGQGHSIKGVFIDERSKNEVGLFSSLERTATIKNLTVEGVINGGDYVGGIVGKNANARIENCVFNGNITAGIDYGYVGGIAGYGSGTITGCKTYGELTVRLDYVSDSLLNGASGGIIGYMTLPTTVVSGCENNMTLTSNGMSLGGIAGQSMMRAGIQDCTNNGSVNGYRQVGGILGRLVVAGSGGAVADCVNNGSITASDEDAGGIVGVTSGGDMRIVGCKNTGSVTAKLNAAGILGHNSGVTVERCCNLGSIRAASFAGGIIGKDSSNGALNCYNLGSIRADNWAGGISAYLDNAHGAEGRMTNCYNMGEVSSESGKAAPLGSVYQDANVFSNCYYLSPEKNETVENHTGLTKVSFTSGEVAYKLGDAFGQKIGTDMNPVFRADGNKVLFGDGMYYNEGGVPHEHVYDADGICTVCGAKKPAHEHSYGAWVSDGSSTHSRSCAECGSVETAEHDWNGGVVTRPATEDAEGEMTYTCSVCSEVKKESIPKLQSKSISIGTLEELIAFAKAVDEGESYKDCTVTLTSDIDASGIEWEPIGSYVKASEYKAFAGTFDGCGHTVKINATGSASSGVGFIAVNEGTVKNLTVSGSVSGKSYVGSVVGYNLGSLSDCVSKANVSAVSMSVGGVTGYMKGSAKIERCANLGVVTGTGTTYTGGVVGQTLAGTSISECYNGGSVTASKGSVGGVAGYTAGCKVNSCYNVGSVNCTAAAGNVGGIVGWFTGTVNLENSYNAGSVSGGKTVGAISGIGVDTQLVNCYYLTGTAQYASGTKNFVGTSKSADEMKSELFVKTLGEAFKTAEDGINDGFPVLAWQSAKHEHVYTSVGVCTVCGEKDPEYKNTFSDVGEYYATDAVIWASYNKITYGVAEGLFAPDEFCTRAQILTMLYRVAGEPKVESAKNPFTDVHEDDYYYNAVLWAVEKGITYGTSADKFSPHDNCTRAEIVTFLYRAAGEPKVTASVSFTDVGTDAFYANAVAWAVDNGITYGTSTDKFSPYDTCTRAQAVTFLYRCCVK